MLEKYKKVKINNNAKFYFFNSILLSYIILKNLNIFIYYYHMTDKNEDSYVKTG